MSNLLEMLLKFISPRSLDDVEPAYPEEEPEEPEEVEEPEELEEEEEPEEEEEVAPRPVSRAQKEIITLRERAQKAEEAVRKAAEDLEAARRQSAQPAAPSQEAQLRAQEDAILQNPEATEWQRYSIQAARDARQAMANSNAVMRESRDLQDRNEFERIGATKPKTFAAYKDRVEETLRQMRANGNDAPRAKLFALMVGEDMLNGKLKTAEAKAAKTGGARRGSTPGARSDISSSSGKQSDAEKRAKRLENVRI